MNRRKFIALTSAGTAVALLPRAGRTEYTSSEADARARELVAEMTLDEKTLLMTGNRFNDISQYNKAGARYPNPNYGCPRLGIPAVRFMDGPAGVRFDYQATCFPAAIGRGASFDPELEERVGEAIGYEGRALGANQFGGIVVNLLRHPRWGRAQETFGEDSHHLGAMGSATVRGVAKYMMPTVKHFAGNSIENTRKYLNVRMSERVLREVYLPHFKTCVDAGAASVMSAYNKLNGEYCSYNRHLLTEILKEEWGFDGFVMSDFDAVQATVPAVMAGLDLEMPKNMYYGEKLAAKVLAGDVPIEQVDESCVRIVRTMLRFGIFETPDLDVKRVAGREHAALALKSAEKSLVLLKNDGGLLPLDPTKIKKIALIGPFAGKLNLAGTSSSMLFPPYRVTPEDGIRQLAPNMDLILDKGKFPFKAAESAREADAAIVFVGLTEKEEKENVDRRRMILSRAHETLIRAVARANKNTIVVLSTGSALVTERWIGQVPSALVAWYPGMEGGNAIARVIFGQVNPSAKLPMVWPKSEDQLPPFHSFAREVEYDYFYGYRHMDKEKLEPRFHFGHGLSYTTYEYSNLQLNKKQIPQNGVIQASVDVTNSGKFAGEEVVQLYVGYKGSKVERFVKDLKGFTRVGLDPGQTKTVNLELNAKDLAFYNVKTATWEVEPIRYEIYVGPSSNKKDLLSAEFEILA
jgi:beta-glucosidase